MFARLRHLRSQRVRKRLLRLEEEVIVDEVFRHWVVYTVPVLECVAAIGFLWVVFHTSADFAWLPLLVMCALLTHAGWTALDEYMDVFVVTNMRVFRVRGVLSQRHATTPLARILDITVEQPFLGLVLRYGHFVFESAAQEQGLRDIRYVARPLQRDLVIQGVVQRAGLRGPRHR